MTLQKGDVIAVRGTTWVSRMIERITRSKYSHVAVYLGNGMVMEAQGACTVGYMRLSAYAGQYDVYRLKSGLTDFQTARILTFLATMLGRKYDYFDIFILWLRYALRLKFPYHETKKFICETLVYDAYKHAGIALTMDDNESPGDLVASEFLEQVKPS